MEPRKSHKGLEQQIEGMARRIKESEESPDQTAGIAEGLFRQLRMDKLEAHLAALEQGKPTLEGEGGLSRFYIAAGFRLNMGHTTAQHETTPRTFVEHKAICDRMGFPADKLCDKVVSQLAIREMDAMPKPDVILADSHGCDVDHKYYGQTQGDLFNIPTFFVDVPISENDKPTLASLSYIADQLREFVEWAKSKVPGIKYDEARHIEMLEMDAIGEKYWREIFQLNKHVPCPTAPMDIAMDFTHFQPSRFPNMRRVVESLRIMRDKLGEVVASGKGPYPEERLRLLWAGKVHGLTAFSPSKMLLERKVAVPFFVDGSTCYKVGLRGTLIGEVVPEYGVKLSPLQEEAAYWSNSCWGGPGKRWVNMTLKAARDIGAQGIVHFLLIGCTPYHAMGSVVADRAEKELGIPTLNFEGRYLDPEYMSQEQFEEILSPFIDKCFDRAGKPRQ